MEADGEEEGDDEEELPLGAAVKALLPGASFQQRHDAALNLALAVNTDAAGELLVRGGNAHLDRKASLLEQRLANRMDAEQADFEDKL